MSLTIYFLRHGETSYSKTGAYCGDLDTELTAEGVQMAKEFADVSSSIRSELQLENALRP